MDLVSLLLLAVPMVPAAASEPLPPITAEQAIANFEEQYRRARTACERAEDPDEVVVCAQQPEESPYRIAASTRVPGYRPPVPGQLFEANLGPVRVACCAISTGNGSGAGISLTLPF